MILRRVAGGCGKRRHVRAAWDEVLADVEYFRNRGWRLVPLSGEITLDGATRTVHAKAEVVPPDDPRWKDCLGPI